MLIPLLVIVTALVVAYLLYTTWSGFFDKAVNFTYGIWQVVGILFWAFILLGLASSKSLGLIFVGFIGILVAGIVFLVMEPHKQIPI